MLLVKFLDPGRSMVCPGRFQHLRRQLITIGSIANMIVIEQAAACGVTISFRDHARVGIPLTLVSFAVLVGWIGV